MPKHALLSASSSDRWIHCPPSARLSETYEDKGSDYAAEGTDAHSLCEYKLKKALGMEADDPTEHLSWFNQEMDDHATGYAAYVLEQVEAAKETCSDPVVLIEQRVDFSRWVEEGFGTADCIVIADGTLQIIDFKYGLGVLVSAEENPQIMIPILFDTTALEAEHDELLQETQVVSDMVQQCIYENAHVALDQAEYQKRYDALTQRFDKAKARLEEVTEEISQKQTQRANYEAFLKAFEKLPDQLPEFTLETWHGLVDYATVYAEDDIRFTFKNGQEVKA